MLAYGYPLCWTSSGFLHWVHVGYFAPWASVGPNMQFPWKSFDHIGTTLLTALRKPLFIVMDYLGPMLKIYIIAYTGNVDH